MAGSRWVVGTAAIVLIVVAVVAGMAVLNDDPSEEEVNRSLPSEIDDDPPVEKIEWVIATLDASNATVVSAEHDAEAHERLETGITAYRDDTRIDVPVVFEAKADAMRILLARNNSTDGDEAELNNVTLAVVEASNETARTKFDDAERTASASDGERMGPGSLQDAEEHLQRANESLHRAEAVRDDADSGDFDEIVDARAEALTHYEEAWRQARLAGEAVDDTSRPQVNEMLTHYTVDNGTFSVTIYGYVIDDQGRPVDTAIAVAGNRTTSLEVSDQQGYKDTTLFEGKLTAVDADEPISLIAYDEEHRRLGSAETAIDPSGDEDEIQTVPIAEPESGIEVEATGPDIEETAIGIQYKGDGSRNEHIDIISHIVVMTSHKEIDSAKVTIPLHEKPEHGAGVFRWDTQGDDLWLPTVIESDREVAITVVDSIGEENPPEGPIHYGVVALEEEEEK